MGGRYLACGRHAGGCGPTWHLAWLRILYATSRPHRRRSGRTGTERERARRGAQRARPRHSRERALGEIKRLRDRGTLTFEFSVSSAQPSRPLLPFRPKISKTTPCTVAKWLSAQAFSVIPKKHLTRRANQGHICIIPPIASRPWPC